MSGGCTSCGNKGGCDSRKHGMFAAVDDALARLYPTRRWTERDEGACFGAGVSAGEGAAIARALAARLKAQAIHRSGSADETCDYVYVLCVGRTPSLLERVLGLTAPEGETPEGEMLTGEPIDELYLRVALSSLVRFAGVQQVAMRAERDEDGHVVVTEVPRTGVFDPVLLKRFQALVAVLAEHDVRHLDFGEILEPPAAFDPGDYGERYGGQPAIANYLFFPQPASTVSTFVLTAAERPRVARPTTAVT